VLPNLNGLGGEHLAKLFAGFRVESVGRHGWIRRRRPPSSLMNSLSRSGLPVRVLDAITSSVSSVVQKPG
jgi:hypothetical protein